MVPSTSSSAAEDQRVVWLTTSSSRRRTSSFSFPTAPGSAFLKVDGSAEQLPCVFMEHAVGPDLADRFFSLPVECHVVHIEHAVIGNCVGNVCCKLLFLPIKLSLTAIVDPVTAKE